MNQKQYVTSNVGNTEILKKPIDPTITQSSSITTSQIEKYFLLMKAIIYTRARHLLNSGAGATAPSAMSIITPRNTAQATFLKKSGANSHPNTTLLQTRSPAGSSISNQNMRPCRLNPVLRPTGSKSSRTIYSRTTSSYSRVKNTKYLNSI